MNISIIKFKCKFNIRTKGYQIDFHNWMKLADQETNIWLQAFASLSAGRLPVSILSNDDLTVALEDITSDAKSIGFVPGNVQFHFVL